MHLVKYMLVKLFFFYNVIIQIDINICHNAEMNSMQTSSVIDLKTFDTPAAPINLKPPPLDRHKSFHEDEFSKKPTVPTIVKKTVAAPANVKSYSIADLQIATGSFSVDQLLGEGSFGRVYRAQFDDGKVPVFSASPLLRLVLVVKI